MVQEQVASDTPDILDQLTDDDLARLTQDEGRRKKFFSQPDIQSEIDRRADLGAKAKADDFRLSQKERERRQRATQQATQQAQEQQQKQWTLQQRWVDLSNRLDDPGRQALDTFFTLWKDEAQTSHDDQVRGITNQINAALRKRGESLSPEDKQRLVDEIAYDSWEEWIDDALQTTDKMVRAEMGKDFDKKVADEVKRQVEAALTEERGTVESGVPSPRVVKGSVLTGRLSSRADYDRAYANREIDTATYRAGRIRYPE